ncbi:MAG TPA: hypothetical protein VHH34_07680 [Pseudonocardiaceae bacterium]|nr:hypothetical protein [Pseudonocardiaceae bacterium]
MVDLDADEDGAGGCSAEAGSSDEAMRGDGHVGFLGVGPGGMSGDVPTLEIDMVTAHHHVM